jgi:hypothetical protein
MNDHNINKRVMLPWIKACQTHHTKARLQFAFYLKNVPVGPLRHPLIFFNTAKTCRLGRLTVAGFEKNYRMTPLVGLTV